jgi:ribosomal protein S5
VVRATLKALGELESPNAIAQRRGRAPVIRRSRVERADVES